MTNAACVDPLVDLIRDVRTLKAPKRARQVRRIAPITEWLESPYYVGEDGVRLYDVWKEELRRVFESKHKISEWIVHGSLGSGKSTAAEFALIRKIYELSCFEPIPYLFDFMRSSTIYFIYFSITLFQAERTGFGKIRRVIDTIPYFARRFSRNRDKNSVLEFRNISVIPGSDVGHQVGTDLIGALLDEANFMDRRFNMLSKDYSKVAKIYSAVLNRRLNRFVKGGVDHGLSILVSSAATTSSFTESRILNARDNPHAVVSEVTAYKVKRHEYQREEFCVFLGTEMVDPAIVASKEDLEHICETLAIDVPDSKSVRACVQRLPKDFRHLFEWVPRDFRAQFEQNLLDAIQDVIGKSTRPLGKLFQARSKYLEVVRLAARKGYRHPFSSEKITISTEDSRMIQDFLVPDRMGPRRAARSIHVDQSKSNDRTGIASAFVDGYLKVEGGTLPIVRVEFVIVIDPPKKPAEIPIERTRLFIEWLVKNRYRVDRVTYDAYGSVESIQILRSRGIAADSFSVDRSDESYKLLVALYGAGPRILHYDHGIYREELFGLNHDRIKGKVDHPEGGSKDAADAVCGAVANAVLAIQPEPSIRFIS